MAFYEFWRLEPRASCIANAALRDLMALLDGGNVEENPGRVCYPALRQVSSHKQEVRPCRITISSYQVRSSALWP